MNHAEAVMDSDPTAALDTLRTVKYGRIISRARKARYALLMSQAQDKNFINVDRDTLIYPALVYLDRSGTDHERAMAYYYYGSTCDYAGNQILAADAFKHAEAAAAHTDDENLKGLISYRIGELYFECCDYAEAMKWFSRSAHNFEAAGKTLNNAIALEQYARIHYLTITDTASVRLMRQVEELYRSADDSLGTYRARHTTICARLMSGDNVDSVKADFIRHCLHYGISGLNEHTSSLWGSIYFKSGQYDSVLVCGETTLRYRDRRRLTQTAGCYAEMGYAAERMGDYKKACDYKNRYVALSDSIETYVDKNDITKVERGLTYNFMKERLTVSQQRIHIQQIIGILLCVIIFAIGIAMRRAIIKARNSRIRTRIKMEHLNEIYTSLTEQHRDLIRQMEIRNIYDGGMVTALEARISNFRDLIEQAQIMKPTAFLREFQRLMTINPRIESTAFNDLQFVVNQKYYGILDHLKTNYPDLSKSDLDLCALICFGFSHSSICYVYGYNDISTLYNKRYRLRGKLNLSQSCLIEDFIRQTVNDLREVKERG